jgi:hypothetical protein
MLRAVLSFGVSICILSVFQAALVALPAPREIRALARLRSGWWALIPAASVVAFVFGARAASGAADGLTYVALVAVPPLAACAAGWAMRGARPWLATAAVPLFALAWADRHGLAGEAAAVLLEGLSCVTLGVLLVAVTPRALVKIGIVAMAAADAWLVVSDLLQSPNNALNLAAPVAHLPQLQRAVFGSAVMGYGDLFIAALFGALVAARLRVALRAALAVALLSLASDALFFAVNELPATVPVALVLIGMEAHAAATRRGGPRAVRRPGSSA